jgi:hypothetical protein
MQTLLLGVVARRRFVWLFGALAFSGIGPAPAHASTAESSTAQLQASRFEVPPQQAVALVSRGVVWFDNSSLVLHGFVGADVTLGWISRSRDRNLPQMAASPSAVAALLERSEQRLNGPPAEFVGGVPPRPLVSIPEPKPVAGGGCDRWQPAVQRPIANFVVAGDDLITAGECQTESGEPEPVEVERQPLFVRNLRGGQWHVLRWLAGELTPILAADGDRVAIGVQVFPAGMRVSIVDVRSGLTEARLAMPDGYLGFASRGRLLLSTPTPGQPGESSFPLEPQLRLGERTHGLSPPPSSYRLALYSTHGRRLATLGSASEPPLVSHMRFVTLVVNEAGRSVVTVHDLVRGGVQSVIGFNPPGRRLLTMAFRWPALVVVETTSRVLKADEVNCQSGYYGQASAPFLGIFNLARTEPLLEAPASSPFEGGNGLRACRPRVLASG